MQAAVEIGKGERRRMVVAEGAAALFTRQGHGRHGRVGVDHDRPAEGLGDGSDVDAVTDAQTSPVAYRHTDLVAAEAFVFELPAQHCRQLIGRDQQPLAVDVGVDGGDRAGDDRGRARHPCTNSDCTTGSTSLVNGKIITARSRPISA